MIQVRCPECGYLQTLSEERFLSVSDDFLQCPHCNAKVPKEWNPVSEESLPEEVRHKMLAFSRRILTGGDLTREMVYALESLVRHHGPMKQSTQALGVGYAALGEYRKALEFLVQAEQEAPEDREVKAALLQAYLGAGQFEDAVRAGRMLVNTWGSAVSDDTVAAFALALLNLGRIDDAQALLGSYPGLDPRNPLVKQAKKLLRRVNGSDIWSFLEELTPLHRLFRKAEKTRSHPAAFPDDFDEPPPFADTEPPRPAAARPAPQPEPPQEHIPAPPRLIVKRLKATLEYWIYVPGPSAPKREAIRHRLAELQPAPEARDRVLRMLDTFADRKELSVDYIFRRDAEELFNYPGEIIPKNSRKLSEDDFSTLNAAAMVLRMRLVTADVATFDYLDFMVRYVEAARDLTGGVIQDAISHTLWGSAEWKSKMPANHLSRIIESHVRWDALDESGIVWLHSHGMQKFGLPETELEGIPADLVAPALTLMTLVSETLLDRRGSELDLEEYFSIRGTSLRFVMQARPGDEERHFPVGSLKILPYVQDYDPRSRDTTRHVLRILQSKLRGDPGLAGRSARAPRPPTPEEPSVSTNLKERLLEAHTKAKAELDQFKRSFHGSTEITEAVHAVKVGFPVREDEYEWMWVSVDAWSGTSLAGRLENSPVLRKDLAKGCRVQLHEGEIFDWVIASEGHIVDGAFTEQIAS
ncbi:MAG: DUF2314 domain-containing protein [Thermodesulfobacteriota bacterium]